MAKYIYGIDIGGTTVKMGLFDEKGDMLEKWEIVTRKENNGENILPDIVKSIKEKNSEKSIETDDILGIGMGVPGPITEDGRVLKCANLGWGIFSVADEMSKGVKKVKVGNDANVAALGEQWRGGGRGFDNIVMVTLGTGVGGGIIMNGKILTGENGAAGEIGHITVNPKETLTCGCGCKGCLEQYSSATGVIRLAKERLEASDKPSELRKFADDEIGGKEVFDAYKAGDELAAEAVDEFAAYLGMGLGNVASVVDTQAFVIGGGLSKNGPIVIELIKKQYEKNVMFALKNTEFRLAELGNDAGMYGAVRMVIQ